MRVIHLLMLMLLAFASNPGSAHELSMAETAVRETAPHELLAMGR